MKQHKKWWASSLKTIAILLSVLVFLGLAFIAMNNTVKNMTGESIQVYQNTDGVIFNLYGKGYFINFTPARQINEWLEANWILIPRCVRGIQYIVGLL